jgi:hypothetical protein
MMLRALMACAVQLGLVHAAVANMASSEVFGSRGAAPLVSRQLEVLGERLHILGFGRLDSAMVHASYRILVPPGVHGALPLLFVALERQGPLRVLFNGRPVELGPLPPLDPATYLAHDHGRADELVVGYHGGNGGWVYDLKDLQAFTLDMTPGEHTVDVTYNAAPWIDRGHWVREHSIRYSLSPARHWKRFGPLEVIVETPEAEGLFRTTLGAPTVGGLPGRAVWRFAEIPADVITVGFTPQVGPLARGLMGLSPFGIALLVGMVLLLLHVRWMHRFRLNGHTGISVPLVVGVLLAPLGFLFAFLVGYDLIDLAIGPDAGRFHGYTFLYMGFYPLIMPLYAVGCWLLDRHWKRRMERGLAIAP